LVPLMKFYYNEEVRSAAITTMFPLLNSANEHFKKLGQSSNNKYLTDLFLFMYRTFIEAISEEGEDPEYIQLLLQAMIDCLNIFSAPFFNAEFIQAAMKTAVALINDVVQRRQERQDSKQEQEVEEEDEETIEAEEGNDDDVLSSIAEFFRMYCQITWRNVCAIFLVKSNQYFSK